MRSHIRSACRTVFHYPTLQETYLDHYEYMASLTGEIAEAVAAAGFTGTRVHPGAVLHGTAAARPVPPTQG